MRRKIRLFPLLLTLVLLFAACAPQSPSTDELSSPEAEADPTTSHGNPVEDNVSLIDALRAAGANVVPGGTLGGTLEQVFFAVTGQIIKINSADVQIFEYESVEAMEADATLVAPDGGSVGTNMVTWIAPPHFFKSGRVLVLYVGDDAAILELLTGTLGEQFAGR